MKWNRFTLKTKTEAEDIVICTLAEVGIEGVEIQDKQPLTDEDKAQMFVDIMPEGPADDGIAYLNFYLEEDADTEEMCIRDRSGYEASKNYGQLTKMCPARLDVIEDKNFDLDGIEMIRQYLKDYKLKARPLCADSIEAVSSMGTEFQKYMLGQKTEAEFFAGAQNCIDQYYKKASY